MHQQEVARDTESKSSARSPVAPIDVVEMKTVERLSIKGYGGQNFATRRKQHAIENHDILGDRPRIENVDAPRRVVGRVMGDPAPQVWMPTPADGGSVHAHAADDSQRVIVLQSCKDACSEVESKHVDIV